MMINLAHVMKSHLSEVKSKNDLSLKFIFFDGEEAFVQWSATDSIYGARHLAQRWENEGFLHRIDMLMLLDLLGAPDPQFYALQPETLSWYLRLSETEDVLSSSGLLDRYTTSGVVTKSPNKYFNQYSIHAGIEDDHIPFMRRNVPILHLIPVPFPDQWHKLGDDRSAIDEMTCENLMKIFRIYIAEYLHLDIDDE
jgi:glutaminyl-peptide cyclotransferase